MRRVHFVRKIKYTDGRDIEVAKDIELYDSIDMPIMSSIFTDDTIPIKGFIAVEGKCYDIETGKGIVDLW